MHLTVNLTSLAAILWSGMLIIAGSIWILSSQVRRLADQIEDRSRAEGFEGRAERKAPGRPNASVARVASRRVVGRSTSRVN